MSSPGHAGGAAGAARQHVAKLGRGLPHFCPRQGKRPKGAQSFENSLPQPVLCQPRVGDPEGRLPHGPQAGGPRGWLRAGLWVPDGT